MRKPPFAWALPVLVLTPVLLAASPRPARAQVSIKIQASPMVEDYIARAGYSGGVAQFEERIKGEVEKAFQTYRLKEYVRAIGDAQSFTTRGLGVDYGSNFDMVTVGFAGNLALNADKASAPKGSSVESVVPGLAASLTAMAGANLDFLGPPLAIYGNFYNDSGTLGDLDVKLRNWGVHLQLRLFRSDEESLVNALLRWGGFDITTGFESASSTMTLGKTLKRRYAIGQNDQKANVDLNSDGEFTVDSTTQSIPLEITTNFRLLYILSLYGGAGFDWQLGGQTKTTIGLNGGMLGTLEGSMAPPVNLGTVSVTASERANPSAGRLRLLAGLQVNVMLVKLFVQFNAVTQDPVVASIALGARLAY